MDIRKEDHVHSILGDQASQPFGLKHSQTPIAFQATSDMTAFLGSDFLPDTSEYIPAGCVRISRHSLKLTTDIWVSCNKWYAIPCSKVDLLDRPNAAIYSALHDSLRESSTLRSLRALHDADWIRLQFKIRDEEWGQIRVYILPDDVARVRVPREDRFLRKCLQTLLPMLDTQRDIWDGAWSPETCADSRSNTLGDPPVEGEQSLFYMFNTLPSPKPDMSVVRDKGARIAMEDILKGTIDGIVTKMLPYQRRSAAMMLQREVEPGQIIDPRLRRSVDMNGSPWFCDIISGTVLREPRVYEAARGGICAETMGLGKTLICLALIMATREHSSQIPVEYSVGTIPNRKKVGSLLNMCAATIGRMGIPWKAHFGELQADGSEYSQCTDAIRREVGHYYVPAPRPKRTSRRPVERPPRKVYLSTATLVVVPSNLVRQWEREIEKHTSSLKVLVMKDSKSELPPALELREYDIILFSRQRFEQESKDATDTHGMRSPLQEIGPSSTSLYHSPLRDVHFKRLITDEGHTMGNATASSRSNAVVVVDFLHLTSRWIVSGTPTGGLYGSDIPMSNEIDFEGDLLESSPQLSSTSSPQPTGTINLEMVRNSPAKPTTRAVINVEQERKDLEKLGNIAKLYLKSRPWSNSREDPDHASWSSYVMQPRHGLNSHGSMACLQNTLEGMMIRHRPEDVLRDIGLPPLHQKTVYLEGSLQDKLSINLFSLMITSNAVTSERKDADYLFHPSQRRALASLVANLRQASFFWSGFTKEDVEVTIEIAKTFLEKGTVYTTNDDRLLLQKVVDFGTVAFSNPIWLAASELHEMPVMLENNAPTDIQKAWALDGRHQNPTLLGATQLRALQKFASTYSREDAEVDHDSQRIWSASIDELAQAGFDTMKNMRASLTPAPRRSNSKLAKVHKRLDDSAPALAGGLRVGGEPSPKRKSTSVATSPIRNNLKMHSQLYNEILPPKPVYMKSDGPHSLHTASPSREATVSSVAERSSVQSVVGQALDTARIISTASAKLSYLVSQVLKYQRDEKIIIFYETDNVAFYIAQALEAVAVEHLIYAKTLSSERRSRYLETFNHSIKFRVLLMDIAQAAFGLDISSASRVYFVNPVLSRQVEAQAVKRAHRMGQLKPVYVEILVMKETIEEMIVQRREEMTSDEQKKCKTVLDDQTMYDWIKNARFLPIPDGPIPSQDQMAVLEVPQQAFGQQQERPNHPDDGLLLDLSNEKRRIAKGKRKASMGVRARSPEHVRGQNMIAGSAGNFTLPQRSSTTKRRRVTFLITSDEEENVQPGPSSAGSPAADTESDSSPTKEHRARLDTNGAQSLLVKLQCGRRGAGPAP